MPQQPRLAREMGLAGLTATGVCSMVGSVGVFYMLFTAAVYHAVPWEYIADEAERRDLTAPRLLGYLLPPLHIDDTLVGDEYLVEMEAEAEVGSEG